MPALWVQNSLKTAFEHWGRPQVIRFDNGQPWANPGKQVPTALALWLIGLGIDLVFGRPRQSTDNAVVERCHGVLNQWVEPHTCASIAELASRLERFARIQREEYLACQGRTRKDAYPALYQPVRPYSRQQDGLLWQLNRVLEYVAQIQFTRRVEKNGRITLMTHEYAVGKEYRRQAVTIRLDPQHRRWIVKDRDGDVLKSFPANQLTYDTIAGMKMTYRHFKAKLNDVSGEV